MIWARTWGIGTESEELEPGKHGIVPRWGGLREEAKIREKDPNPSTKAHG